MSEFIPWIGANYIRGWRGSGKKVLVLGESHYAIDDMPEDGSGFTIRCVLRQRDGLETSRFWTNTAITFFGHLPSIEEKRCFWDSVAFANFIPSFVGDGPRQRPTKEMWERGRERFPELLNKVSPDFVLALGVTLTNNLPLETAAGPEIEDSRRPCTYWYEYGQRRRCLLYGIRHPSSSFNGRYWHPFVIRALSLS